MNLVHNAMIDLLSSVRSSFFHDVLWYKDAESRLLRVGRGHTCSGNQMSRRASSSSPMSRTAPCRTWWLQTGMKVCSTNSRGGCWHLSRCPGLLWHVSSSSSPSQPWWYCKQEFRMFWWKWWIKMLLMAAFQPRTKGFWKVIRRTIKL